MDKADSNQADNNQHNQHNEYEVSFVEAGLPVVSGTEEVEASVASEIQNPQTEKNIAELL